MRKYMSYAKILSILGLLLLISGVTYSFFNYTKTGSPNTFSLGRINFSSDQTDTITLANVFPMSKQEVLNNQNYDEKVTINITGDTAYNRGIEYLITAEDVSVTVNNKRVPVTLYIDNTEDLGTEDESYWTNRGGNTTIYKSLANSVIVPGQYLFIGYIAPGVDGIDGSIDIKGYIDKDKIVISDTYDGTESDEMGTTNDWVNGRVVLTTEEWNSLQSESELSFKIKVEANEGLWVPEESNPNAINNIYFPVYDTVREIRFVKETPLRMEKRYNDATYKVDQTYNNEGKVLSWLEEDILYIASSGETYFTTGYQLFPRFFNVEKIVFENINTERVLTMENMFISLSHLREVNVEAFDTSNVTTMEQMFLNCASLESVNLSTWDTSNVVSMKTMFFSNSNLESINLDGLGGEYLQDISAMFKYCSKLKNISMRGFNFGSVVMNANNSPFAGIPLETIDLSNADASNVITMPAFLAVCSQLRIVNMDEFKFGQDVKNMFNGLRYLESVSLKNADSSKVTDMSSMFSGSSITSIDLSGLGGANLLDVTNMFGGCSNLREINMSNFNFGEVTSLSTLFSNLSNLEKVNLSGANTSNVIDMSKLFYSCPKLETINLDRIDTSNVENMEYMFHYCTKLVNVNISGLGGNRLTTIENIFSSCSNLEKVNMSNFNFGLVNQINYSTFGGFTKLKEVDLSNSKMDNITSLAYAFDGSSNLEVLNLSGISNTSGVSNFFAAFRYTKIKTIDLSGFTTNNVTSVENMFKDCNLLETIYVNANWNVSGSSPGAETFSGCPSLVGGAGTVYTSGNSGHEYAHIDGGVSNPGYLTLKTS